VIWQKYSYQILDVCSRINESANGSGEPQSAEWLRDAIDTLKDRVTSWRPTGKGMAYCEEYDSAVVGLMVASINLATRDLDSRKKPSVEESKSCGKECDHGWACLLPHGHEPADRHETQHGCIFYGDTR
jgi:hypothetical protein